jgi:hypothetical protein
MRRRDRIPVDRIGRNAFLSILSEKLADYLFKSESFRTSGLMKAKRLLMQQEG